MFMIYEKAKELMQKKKKQATEKLLDDFICVILAPSVPCEI